MDPVVLCQPMGISNSTKCFDIAVVRTSTLGVTNGANGASQAWLPQADGSPEIDLNPTVGIGPYSRRRRGVVSVRSLIGC